MEVLVQSTSSRIFGFSRVKYLFIPLSTRHSSFFSFKFQLTLHPGKKPQILDPEGQGQGAAQGSGLSSASAMACTDDQGTFMQGVLFRTIAVPSHHYKNSILETSLVG